MGYTTLDRYQDGVNNNGIRIKYNHLTKISNEISKFIDLNITKIDNSEKIFLQLFIRKFICQGILPGSNKSLIQILIMINVLSNFISPIIL